MSEDAPGPDVRQHPMPFTRMEIAVFGLVDERLQVLLARRAGAPFKGRWALPGGVLRIDLDKDLADAARRVTHERLGLELPYLRQLCAVGGARRDPRAPWALSVIYRALVGVAAFRPETGKRIEALAWRPVEDAIGDDALAFDHGELIAQALAAMREEVERLDIPFASLPQPFTLGELQSWCEQLLGRPLDKSSFRRKLADRNLVEAVEGEMKGGANRPAQLYRPRSG